MPVFTESEYRNRDERPDIYEAWDRLPVVVQQHGKTKDLPLSGPIRENEFALIRVEDSGVDVFRCQIEERLADSGLIHSTEQRSNAILEAHVLVDVQDVHPPHCNVDLAAEAQGFGIILHNNLGS